MRDFRKSGVKKQQDLQEQRVKESTLITSRRLSPFRSGQRNQEMAERMNKKLWALGSSESSPERDMQRIGAIGNTICQMWKAPISEEAEELQQHYTLAQKQGIVECLGGGSSRASVLENDSKSQHSQKPVAEGTPEREKP